MAGNEIFAKRLRQLRERKHMKRCVLAELCGMNKSMISRYERDKGWELLGLLPKEELDRIDTKILNKYYKETVR